MCVVCLGVFCVCYCSQFYGDAFVVSRIFFPGRNGPLDSSMKCVFFLFPFLLFCVSSFVFGFACFFFSILGCCLFLVFFRFG